MPSATTNDASIHYLDKGKGANILVLLHGFPLSGEMWSPQVDAFAGDWRVIVPDFRGFGKSGETGPFSIEQLADDVHALIQQLKLEKIVLAGLSMGGYVSLAYIKKYPQTLRGLILLDTKAQPDTADGKTTRDRMIAIAHQKGAKAIADLMLPKLVPEEVIQHRPQITRALRQMMETTPPATIAHALAAMRDRPDTTEVLAKVAVPALCIVGEKDGITPPEVMRAMQEKIPKGQIKLILGAGHMSNMEQPSLVNAAIKQFLAPLSA